MKYLTLAKLYEELETTTKRLAKTKIVSDFLKKQKFSDDLIHLVQGKIFPNWDKRKIGVAEKLILKAISISTGNSVSSIQDKWREIGDIGEVAEELSKKKKQATLFSQSLTIKKVKSNLEKLATIEGSGTVSTKVQLIAELLSNASPLEAKYIIRTIIGDMRTGMGEGVMRDSITWAYLGDKLNIKYDKDSNSIIFKDDRKEYDSIVKRVDKAFHLTNDFAQVAEVLHQKGLEGLKELMLTPGKPIKVMLYPKADSIEDALKTVGSPAVCEYKFDGFRLQIHKKDDKITMFTRRLEEVSKQFPDILAMAKKDLKADSVIIDCEAIGFDPKTKKYLPFQQISQRIKRKYDIEALAKKFPVEVNVFDVMYYDGETLVDKPLKDRYKILKKIIRKETKFRVIEQLVTDDPKKIKKYYKEALKLGNEGLMIKNLEGKYQSGKRVGGGVKLKPTMETLDLVIIGGEWGEGKRSKWISSFKIACADSNGQLLEIGRFATGLKEKPEEGTSFGEVTELLKPLITSTKGKDVIVKPKIVVEVRFEEIQKSPSYSSGYALRFPRFVRLRTDRGVKDISNLELIEQLYSKQRGRK